MNTPLIRQPQQHSEFSWANRLATRWKSAATLTALACGAIVLAAARPAAMPAPIEPANPVAAPVTTPSTNPAAATRTTADTPRCVGMFIDSNARGGQANLIATNAVSLTVRGTIPCMDSVQAWSKCGPYRVFEDGTVEMLVTPIPPCNGGDYYVWIAYPK